MPRNRLAYLTAVSLLAFSVSLLAAAGASAQQTIGWTPSTPPTSAYCVNSPVDLIDLTQGTDPSFSYVVPSTGVITSWSTSAWPGEDQRLTFKVFRPTGAEVEYTALAADLRVLTPGVLNTFRTDVPVRAGDVIGAQDTGATEHPTACAIETGDEYDEVVSEYGDLAVGETQLFEDPEPEVRLNISATLLVAPRITSLGTTSGSTAGGASVTISGSEFAEVQSVTFGSTAAAYTVDSESQITATAPAGSLGEVPVTVTTVAGNATSSQKFTYTAPVDTAPAVTSTKTSAPSCTVPSVKGLKLRVARERVKAAHCALGENIRKKGANNRDGKVVGQTLKAGTTGPFETVVRVTLGKTRN